MKAHEKLAEAIEASPLSLEEIAERSHVTPTALRKYAEGKRIPRGPEIINIAKTLGMDPKYIPGHPDNPARKDQASKLRNMVGFQRQKEEKKEKGQGFCSLIMATCPEPDPEEPTGEVCGHCPLAKMAKEYREKAEKIDREGWGIRY